MLSGLLFHPIDKETLETPDLDKKLAEQLVSASNVEEALVTAIEVAYTEASGDDSAHRFLQRILYRINQLKLFWYDDLQRHTNERSLYLRRIRDRCAADVDPPPSADGLFYRDEVGEAGYRRLVAIGSLDGGVQEFRRLMR